MRVLVIAGDYYHPAEVVEDGISSIKDVEFTVTQTKDEFKKYDVVMLCKSNRISAEDAGTYMDGAFEEELSEWVHQGGGLLTVHAGTTAPKTAGKLLQLIGSKFNHHPEECEVHCVPVAEHTMVQGIKEFAVKDEHYFLDIEATDISVFLQSVSENGTQIAGYTRCMGKGRVAVLTPGHNTAVWHEPGMQELLYRSIFWCGGSTR